MPFENLPYDIHLLIIKHSIERRISNTTTKIYSKMPMVNRYFNENHKNKRVILEEPADDIYGIYLLNNLL